jgi:periplasmic divalent cation tolerance protein
MGEAEVRPDDLMLVITTVAAEPDAERLVGALLEQRLVACGNVLPGVASIYRWQGQVQREAELIVLLKTTRSRVDEVLKAAARLHPYEVPELLAVAIDGGSAPYRRWVKEETSEVSE